MTAARATLLGFGAVLLWGALATLTALTGPVPPFQTTAISFSIGGAVGIAAALARGRADLLMPPPAALALGLVGFFVYHAMYFAALKLAPAAEANLIAALWALLIVVFSALLPGHALRPRHLVGACLGFAAAAILIWPRLGAGGAGGTALLGYGLAGLCALTWSSYSVASRLFADVPTELLGVTCLATAVLAAICHVAFETTVVPARASEWLGLVGLGLGPVGAAFFLWDVGMKRGNVSLLGALSYAAPVISTGMLVLAGLAPASWTLAAAVALMVVGAAISTSDR